MAEIDGMARRDVGDLLRFEVGSWTRRAEEQGHPEQDLATVGLTAYAGGREVGGFTVDVVTGSITTGVPERRAPDLAISVPGLRSPEYLLYPVVDHVADKVAATMRSHPSGPSTRPKDLVDLVVIARTQTVDAAGLAVALEAERVHSGLDPIGGWRSPLQWARQYERMAAGVPYCADHRTYAAGTALVESFLNPVLSGEVVAGRWDPEAAVWQLDGPAAGGPAGPVVERVVGIDREAAAARSAVMGSFPRPITELLRPGGKGGRPPEGPPSPGAQRRREGPQR